MQSGSELIIWYYEDRLTIVNLPAPNLYGVSQNRANRSDFETRVGQWTVDSGQWTVDS